MRILEPTGLPMGDTVAMPNLSEAAISFARDGDEDGVRDYKEIASRMTSSHQALLTVLELAAKPFADERYHREREHLQGALHYAAVTFGGYDLANADWAFGWGAR